MPRVIKVNSLHPRPKMSLFHFDPRHKMSLFQKVHAPECYRNHEGYQAELQDFWKRQDIEMLTDPVTH